jgi:hypothetical protein
MALRVELCWWWTTKTHKTRKRTGMNLEDVEDKIWDSVWVCVRLSMCISMDNSAYNSVVVSVRDSVDFGLAAPIRQERRQG